MSKINLMPKELANKIAAGEVVERPASIVKELTENSIDAESTAITIEIKDGGVSYVRVTDNGTGIPRDEVEKAFLRHATSKIYSDDDLYSIKTLGFRGEALASIAAVAKVEIQTKTRNDTFGKRVVIEGGEVIQSVETGCPEGTSIVVTDLYFNTPARLKFLKKPSAETAFISDIVSRLILANPNIAIKYIVDDKIVLHSPGDGSLLSCIHAVYGRFTAENMLMVDYQDGDIAITGCIGNSNLEKNNKTYQSIYINGRYIKDQALAQAVSLAYTNRITIGKFPMYVLYISIPYEYVDVNVHPNKTEVRISQEINIYDTVMQAIKQRLDEDRAILSFDSSVEDLPPAMMERVEKHENLTQELPPSKPIQQISLEDFRIALRETNALPVSLDLDTQQENSADATPQAQQAPATLQPKSLDNSFDLPVSFEEYNIVGQLFLTYIVIENNDTAFIIDQHAAHERLLFERLSKEIDSGSAVSQQLLTPLILNVNFAEERKLNELMPSLKELGFNIELFGPGSYAVRSVPLLFGIPESTDMITKILDEADGIIQMKNSQVKREKLMQTACKHAIKAGKYLTKEEIRELMHLIKDEEVPLSCPHGRPILIQLTKKDLETRFKRIQP